jgi:hypothetical protein
MFCQTYIALPVAVQSAIFIVISTLYYFVKKCIPTIRLSVLTTIICIIAQFGNLIYLSTKNISLPGLQYDFLFGKAYEQATIDIPSSGWFVDYEVSIYIAFIHAIFTLGEFIMLTNKGELKYNGLIMYTMFIIYSLIIDAGPLILLTIVDLNYYIKHIATSTKFLKYIHLVIYSLAILYEMYLWIPYAIKWMDMGHCFIDGFMSTTNPYNLYITTIIVLADITMIGFLTEKIDNKLILAFLLLLSFFNNACVISVCSIYLILTINKIKQPLHK